MKIWMNKKSGQLMVVTPWWAIAPNMEPILETKVNGHDIFVGSMYKCGWMLSNQHGVFFGLNLSAEKEFEEIGDL